MQLKKSRRLITAAAVAVGVLAVGGAALAFTNSASAQEPTATISFSGSKLNFQALPGQKNELVIVKSEYTNDDRGPYGESEYTYTFDDVVAIEEVGGTHNCKHASENDRTSIYCRWTVQHGPDPATLADFRLGDLDDKVDFGTSADSHQNDLFHLGAGMDRYESIGSEDSSIIQGGAGTDTIQTGNLTGELARVEGGSGTDYLRVKGEGASAWGNAGDDYFFGGAGRQIFYGGSDGDVMKGGSGNDELYGGAGDDSLRGERGNDKLWGNGGKDSLYGGLGDDSLNGGLANDTLDGGAGKNKLKQ